MIATLVCLLPLVPAADRPAVVRLLAGTELYRQAAGAEVVVEGLVERVETSGRVEPAGRFNLYRLRYRDDQGREAVRELHVPDRAHLLAGHVGKQVRLRGKMQDIQEKGKVFKEFWPAELEPLTGPRPLLPGKDGVIARCDWQPDEARRAGERSYIIRDSQTLAKLMRIQGQTASQRSAELLAQRLKVAKIDWDKHMLVCVCAGLQAPPAQVLRVTGVRKVNGELQVSWMLTPEKDGLTGFGCPAETVLVERFPGPVRVEKAGPPSQR